MLQREYDLLKENCNAKTSFLVFKFSFLVKERSKCWRTICISLESVKPVIKCSISFEVGLGNHQKGISLLQKFSDIFGNMWLLPLKMTSHLTSHNFQMLKIEIFSKQCKI